MCARTKPSYASRTCTPGPSDSAFALGSWMRTTSAETASAAGIDRPNEDPCPGTIGITQRAMLNTSSQTPRGADMGPLSRWEAGPPTAGGTRQEDKIGSKGG